MSDVSDVIELLRRYRVGPFSVFDFTTAYLGALLLAPLIKKLFNAFSYSISLLGILGLVLPLALITHLATSTTTTLTTMVLDPHGHWIAKIAILVSLAITISNINKL